MRKFIILSLISASITIVSAQSVDYSVVYVPEEAGSDFMKITKEGDYVAMPLIKRGSIGLEYGIDFIEISKKVKTSNFLVTLGFNL